MPKITLIEHKKTKFNIQVKQKFRFRARAKKQEKKRTHLLDIQPQLEDRKRQHNRYSNLHSLRKRYEKRDECENAQHNSRYNAVLYDKKRLSPNENLVANLRKRIVLDPIRVFDLMAIWPISHHCPFVVFGVVLEGRILDHQRVVEISASEAPAAKDDYT